MAAKVSYLPKYDASWALVIGINKYKKCSPLDYAGNDATAVAAALTEKFGFPEKKVEVLADKEATKAAILSAMFRHIDGGPNDRGLIFFAGHGHTSTGRRGEVGFLVPYDGDCDDLASLIRWDELTRNADLLPAKHVLFIMDACYGGLAVTRRLHPGSARFLKDMLGRHARQVLTAGKANEVVADGDGPRAGNSLFTGHLLDALDGAAATKDGYLTANGVMAYVYDRVAKDQHSQQTPHYGFIDGDGDFIFSELPANLLADDAKGGKDVMVGVPATVTTRPKKTAAAPIKKKAGGKKATVVLSSGDWVLLGDAFYKAQSVESPDDKRFVVTIATSDAADEARLKAIRSQQHTLGRQLPFAFGNDAFVVRCESAPSTFEGGAHKWRVALLKEDVQYGGHMMESSYSNGSQNFSAEDFARMRAERILLGAHPAPPSDRRSWQGAGDTMIEMFVQGSNNHLKVTGSPIQELAKKMPRTDAGQYLTYARLLTLYYLKAGGVAEHIERLALGPLKADSVHVAFSGRRRRQYQNVDPVLIEVEGDCPLP